MTDDDVRTAILRHVAESKRKAPYTSVREAQIRLAAGVSSPETAEQFRRVLESTIPRELKRESPNDPMFDLTAQGWLVSPLRADLDRVVEGVLGAYRKVDVGLDGRVLVDGAALQAVGLTEDDTGLVLCAARDFFLATPVHGTKQLSGIKLPGPPDVHLIRSIHRADDLYRYRETHPQGLIEFRERLINTLDITTRRLIARVWDEFQRTREWPLLNVVEVEFLDQREAYLRATRTQFFHGGSSTGRGVRLSLSLAGLTHTSGAVSEPELLLKVIVRLADLYAEDPSRATVDAKEVAPLIDCKLDQVMWVVHFLAGNAHVHVDHNQYRSVFSLERQLLVARGSTSIEHLAFRFDEQDQHERTHRRASAGRSFGGFGPLRMLGIGVGPEGDEADNVNTARATNEEPRPISARRKQDKFGILDSPSLFESDFRDSVGALGVSVIYFDLDGFKQINTRFTETVVDRTLLPELQKLILALVTGHGFAYAEGGDEFVIVLPNSNISLAEAFVAVLLERIRSAVFMVGEERVMITASAGLASSMRADDSEACRDAASAAKRDAKEAGKDRYVVSVIRSFEELPAK